MYHLLQNNILHSSNTGVDFMIAIQQCAQIGNHWHSRTWSATCRCWQLNGKLNHTSVYTVGDTARGDQGHKNWSNSGTHAELSAYVSTNLLLYCNEPCHEAPLNKGKQRSASHSFKGNFINKVMNVQHMSSKQGNRPGYTQFTSLCNRTLQNEEEKIKYFL